MVNFPRILVFAALSSAAVALHAQTWPDKSARIIVSNGPGSSPDIVMRMIADRFTRSFGRIFTVENRPGGQSVIGADVAAKAAPDGYTFYLGASSALVMNRFLVKGVPYDPDRDFTYIANVIDSAPFIVVAHPSVPAASLPELIRHAKANPGKLTYGVATGMSDILAQWINKEAGIDIALARYKENRQAVQDALAGRTQVLVMSYPSIRPFVDAGKLRVLAVSSGKRFPGLDDVPAITEIYPGVVVGGWWALVAPTGTPEDIIGRVNREMDKILKEAAFVEKIHSFGFTTSDAMTPAQLVQRTRADVALWARVSKEIELKAE